MKSRKGKYFEKAVKASEDAVYDYGVRATATALAKVEKALARFEGN